MKQPLTHKTFILTIIVVISITFSGCATSKQQLLATGESQVELRSMQTRAFDTTDKEKMLRTVISTLQDLDFVIDRADQVVGTVTASKFTSNTLLKLTVIVRTRGDKQLLVRANAQYGLKAIEDPEPYQDFFTSLEKAIFLTAHHVD